MVAIPVLEERNIKVLTVAALLASGADRPLKSARTTWR